MSKRILHNEREILQQIAIGDEAAFKVFFHWYQPEISYVAFKMLGDKEAVKDVLQEIMSKIWQNRTRLPHLDRAGAYINTLTKNHIYDHFRKMANEDAYITGLIQQQSVAESNFNQLVYKDFITRLHVHLEKLPPQQRKVFQLSKLDGLKLEEVALQMGISRETVKKHLKAAMESLKKDLLFFSKELIIITLISARHIFFK